jgi:hypothetical protein
MSRHPSVKTIKSCEQSIAEHYVKFAMSQAIPRAMTLDEVKIASSKDKTSKALPGWYVIVNLKGCSLKPQRSIRNGGFSSLPYPLKWLVISCHVYILRTSNVHVKMFTCPNNGKCFSPINFAELRSLLGMTNYSSHFIPRYATIFEPLRRLTQNGFSLGIT